MDTYPLTIYSAAAIQELQQQLQSKESRIAEMERDLADVKGLLQALLQKSK